MNPMFIQMGLNMLGAVFQNKARERQAIAEGKAMRAQAYSAIKSMNYAFQNYEHERRDAFDSAVASLSKITMQGRGLQGGVDSAVAEEYGDGGNTGRLLQRSTHADTLRALTGIKDNYVRQSDEIDLNKEAKLMETKDFTSNLHPPKAPSILSNMLNVGLAGLQGYMQFKGAQASQMINGFRASYNNYTDNHYAGYVRPYDKYVGDNSFIYKRGVSDNTYDGIFSPYPQLNYANTMNNALHFNSAYGSRLKIIRR